MEGLVADYGSESEGDISDSPRKIFKKSRCAKKNVSFVFSSQSSNKTSVETPLPKPNFITGSDDVSTCSVFMNPFTEADNAKTAILEKHVKMISTNVKTVNGKKICWNYRKNKCRFGHNCKYAHDSDLQVDKSTIIQLKTTDKKKISVTKIGKARNLEKPHVKKKALRMSQDTVPSKKLMKTCNNHKNIGKT